MSVDTLELSPRRPARLPEAACTPGSPASSLSPGTRKPSAVERLEADKAKYVKTQQVALNKQLPIIRKPLMAPSNSMQLRPGAPQPTRKLPTRSIVKPQAPPLDLNHLSNLINGVSDALIPSITMQTDCKNTNGSETSVESQPHSVTSGVDEELNKLVPSSTVVKTTLADGAGANMSSSVAIRRVDVRPHVPQLRKPCRAQLPEQRVHSQLLQLLRPYMQAEPRPLQPIGIKARRDLASAVHSHVTSPKSPVQAVPLSTENLSSPVRTVPFSNNSPKDTSNTPSPASVQETPCLPSRKVHSPHTPSITCPSSVSSRKRTSLTRSKSDVSDRFSRAGAEVERFFNYCGLDPSDFDDLSPGSDIASVSRLRSASAPASEHTAEGQEEEEEEAGQDEKPSYGISVIERNARVIKWLYGMRQAKDSAKVVNV